jgi:hypothetical protein
VVGDFIAINAISIYEVNSAVDDFIAINATSIQLACRSMIVIVISSMVPARRGKISSFVYEWNKCRTFGA